MKIGPKVREALETPLPFVFDTRLSSPNINLSGSRAELVVRYANDAGIILHLDEGDFAALESFVEANRRG